MRTTWISIWLVCAASTGYAQQREPAKEQAPHVSQAQNKTALTPAEVQTLNQLHAANLKEIAASKLATSRARVQGVKNYGQELLKHHSKADSELQALASRSGVKLTEPKPDEGLSGLNKTINPANFDRAYLDQMSDAHDAAIALVRDAQSTAVNPDLQTLLKDLLPVLQQHREQAVRLLQTNPF
jgi:putative membrane protein